MSFDDGGWKRRSFSARNFSTRSKTRPLAMTDEARRPVKILGPLAGFLIGGCIGAFAGPVGLVAGAAIGATFGYDFESH